MNEYIGALDQDVFRPVKRILNDDGIILWIKIGGDVIASGSVHHPDYLLSGSDICRKRPINQMN